MLCSGQTVHRLVQPPRSVVREFLKRYSASSRMTRPGAIRLRLFLGEWADYRQANFSPLYALYTRNPTTRTWRAESAIPDCLGFRHQPEANATDKMLNLNTITMYATAKKIL